MKYLCVFFGLFLLSYVAQSQEIAITERGDSVVLFGNGTWDYYDNYTNEKEKSIEIKFNEKKYKKPSGATTKITGKNGVYEIWYKPSDWKRLPPAKLNPEADVALQFLGGDVYSMVIYEELEIPVKQLSQIALDNAASVAKDIQMIDREYRVVNSDTVVCMQMEGTTQGIGMVYYSYYYSNKNGSIQFHTFTGKSLLGKYKSAIEDLLNGFMIKEE